MNKEKVNFFVSEITSEGFIIAMDSKDWQTTSLPRIARFIDIPFNQLQTILITKFNGILNHYSEVLFRTTDDANRAIDELIIPNYLMKIIN